MMKARTLLFSSAIHRYPFSIISPKESSTANKQIPDAAGPGFPEPAWVGHVSATSKCLSFFPQPPFPYLNLHFIVTSCKAEGCFPRDRCHDSFRVPSSPVPLVISTRSGRKGKLLLSPANQHWWGRAEGRSRVHPSDRAVTAQCLCLPCSKCSLGSTKPTCWQVDSRGHLMLPQCSKTPEVIAS